MEKSPKNLKIYTDKNTPKKLLYSKNPIICRNSAKSVISGGLFDQLPQNIKHIVSVATFSNIQCLSRISI